MRKHFNGGALLGPLPAVMVSCGSMEKANIITIGWTGIVATKPATTYISVRPERHSYDIIKKTGGFVINMPGTDLVKATDYCGVVSGAKIDKVKHLGLEMECSDKLKLPQIAKCPICIECKVMQFMPMGSHDMILASIEGVSVSQDIIDSKGRICYDKANLLTFAHGEYFEVGRKLGSFGFSVRKKKKYKK